MLYNALRQRRVGELLEPNVSKQREATFPVYTHADEVLAAPASGVQVQGGTTPACLVNTSERAFATRILMEPLLTKHLICSGTQTES
jgi:hypothetical protein